MKYELAQIQVLLIHCARGGASIPIALSKAKVIATLLAIGEM